MCEFEQFGPVLHAVARQSKGCYLLPQVIKCIEVIERHQNALDPNLLIKAFLRRALAYERIDNIKFARLDFQKVKSLD